MRKRHRAPERKSQAAFFGYAAALGLTLIAGCTPAPALDGNANCVEQGGGFRCHYASTAISTEHGDRDLHWALPTSSGEVPDEGWPVVIAFQGSGFPAELYFSAQPQMAFGGHFQGETTRGLLEAGFAVVAPEAQQNGNQYWDTNLVHRNGGAPFTHWENTPDHALMQSLFEHIEAGHLGLLDEERMFAMGISSGGYMTSRMAVSYPGRMRALAVISGGYATCGGAYCPMPEQMPPEHPPTLFIHGEADLVAPFATMDGYRQALDDEGIETRVFSEPGAGHGWLENSDAEVVSHFVTHR